MIQHLPLFPIIIPLIAAPICALMRQRALLWPFLIIVTWTTFASSVTLLYNININSTITYSMGGWVAPIGIEYRLDVLNAFIMVLVSGIAALVSIYARRSVEYEIDGERHHIYYSAFLLCLTGLLGITVTGDAFNVYVFLEISSLASYAIVSVGRDPRALKAAFSYLIMGTIGATFILIAIGMMYMLTGTLNMADLADRLPEVKDTRTIQTAFAFLSVGLTLKIALFPMHSWLPNVYAYAPSVTTIFLSATSTKVSLYIFLRFLFTIYGGDYAFNQLAITEILLPLGLLGVFIATIVAIFQTDLKRLLAYSSIAQIGYIVIGLSMATVSGLTASITHIFNHGLIKAALFMAVGIIVLRMKTSDLRDLSGIGKRMPITSLGFVLGGLGIIGVPLTAGFISKWYLLIGAFEQGWWITTTLLLVSSLLSIVYVWRFVDVAYFKPVPDGAEKILEGPLSMHLGMWLLLGLMIYFGLQTQFSASLAQQAALKLLGGGL
tara:strand:- start:4239 stop:5717 length:1479 start_codon:yes stop_codon:yes gene_type:complete